MSTATNYLEKTARSQPFTAAGFKKIQQVLLDEKDDLAKATAGASKKVGDQIAGMSKGMKKSKKSLKKMKKSATKKSLMYGGGAGAGAGYAGGKVGTNNEV